MTQIASHSPFLHSWSVFPLCQYVRIISSEVETCCLTTVSVAWKVHISEIISNKSGEEFTWAWLWVMRLAEWLPIDWRTRRQLVRLPQFTSTPCRLADEDDDGENLSPVQPAHTVQTQREHTVNPLEGGKEMWNGLKKCFKRVQEKR